MRVTRTAEATGRDQSTVTGGRRKERIRDRARDEWDSGRPHLGFVGT